VKPFDVALNAFEKLKTGNNKLEVAQQVISFRSQYKSINSGVNYQDATARLAYLYSYVGGHASFLAQILTLLHASVGPVFSKSEILVACLGGGPGTDMIGVKHYLELHNSASQVPVVHGCVLDRELGWDPMWKVIAPIAGVTPYFCGFDISAAVDADLVQKIGQCDLITASYLVSEVVKFSSAKLFFENCFAAMKQGAIFVYVDNSGGHTHVFDTYWENSGLTLLLKNDVDPWKPEKVNVEARVFKNIQAEFQQAIEEAKIVTDEAFYPKSSGHLGYRVLRRN
jgi:hypothetical protein